MSIVEYIVLGAAQGIVEWLPVSSEGVLVLLQANLFNATGSVTDLAGVAVFLHLGTLLAAAAYFWNDIADVLLAATRQGSTDTGDTLFKLLLVSTVATGVIGVPLLNALHIIESQYAFTGAAINGTVGVLLLMTGVFLYLGEKTGGTPLTDTGLGDGIVAGVAQGFAILPGVSRSGITVSTLLLRDVDDAAALKLSFLMSIPAVVGGNILFQLEGFTFHPGMVWGLLAAFVTGLIAIHVLLAVADRIDFTWFVTVFGVAMIFAAVL